MFKKRTNSKFEENWNVFWNILNPFAYSLNKSISQLRQIPRWGLCAFLWDYDNVSVFNNRHESEHFWFHNHDLLFVCWTIECLKIAPMMCGHYNFSALADWLGRAGTSSKMSTKVGLYISSKLPISSLILPHS